VREALRMAWRDAGFAEQAMTSRSWSELAALAQSGGAGSLVLPGNVRVTTTAGNVLSLRKQ
jgi:hypothetical protein